MSQTVLPTEDLSEIHTEPTLNLIDRLPPELFPNIFTCLERADLLACSLVSREWRAMVLPVLFRALHLFIHTDSAEDVPRELHLPSGPIRTGWRRTLQSIQQLARDPQYGRYVRRLHLDIIGPEYVGPASVLVDVETLFDTLHAFPRLEHLEMTNIRSRGALERVKPVSLRTLNMHMGSDNTLGNLTEFFLMYRLFGAPDVLILKEMGTSDRWAKHIRSMSSATLDGVRIDARVVRIRTNDREIQNMFSEVLAASSSLRHCDMGASPYLPEHNYIYTPRRTTGSHDVADLLSVAFYLTLGNRLDKIMTGINYFLNKASSNKPLAIVIVKDAPDVYLTSGVNRVLTFLDSPTMRSSLPAITICIVGCPPKPPPPPVKFAFIGSATTQPKPRPPPLASVHCAEISVDRIAKCDEAALRHLCAGDRPTDFKDASHLLRGIELGEYLKVLELRELDYWMPEEIHEEQNKSREQR